MSFPPRASASFVVSPWITVIVCGLGLPSSSKLIGITVFRPFSLQFPYFSVFSFSAYRADNPQRSAAPSTFSAAADGFSDGDVQPLQLVSSRNGRAQFMTRCVHLVCKLWATSGRNRLTGARASLSCALFAFGYNRTRHHDAGSNALCALAHSITLSSRCSCLEREREGKERKREDREEKKRERGKRSRQETAAKP